MSRQLINEYRSELDRIVKVGGSLNEGSVRDAFQGLLKSWGRSHDLTYLSEHKMTGSGGNIYVDGALVYDIRVPFGYWEAKDSKDDLDAEIAAKEAKGYPRTNIIYEDTRHAVLIQDRNRVAEADMSDTDSLYELLTTFFAYEQKAIRDFRKAIAKFAEDLPAILEALRDRIREKREASPDFAKAEEAFLKQVKETINPALERADVTEMLIQHILTEDIFNRVFDMRDYHRDNNIAKQLYALERKLFEYGDKRSLLQALRPYYTGIEETAHLIQSHSEKQNFLKSLYENFYKVYNPKAADRLGVVYTPGEIVRFMIRSADWLCEKHFGKNLVDPGVEILDPATGTGTYIVELLEYFRGQPDKLRQKYKEELHANEVAILPYYVANLNIEATYQAITGQFAEFEGLCLVDTLDNVDGLGIHQGHQFEMLGALSDENIERVKRQNRRKISVIIGNPPYNSWQEEYGQANPNRMYQHIDNRVKRTYVRHGTAQNKNSVYDMYTRFFRWATDRLGEEGVVAFIMGRKPIDKLAYDGFRKVVAQNFADIWLVDLGGDVRDNPKLSGTKHNVFGIQTGVVIAICVKRETKQETAAIHYIRRPEDEVAEDKLSWLSSTGSVAAIRPTKITPDEDYVWLNQSGEDWKSFLALADPKVSAADASRSNRQIFSLSSNGIETGRDEWLWDREFSALEKKVSQFIASYHAVLKGELPRNQLKIDRQLDKHLKKGTDIRENKKSYRFALSRPFTKKAVYFDQYLNAYLFRLPSLFKSDESNKAISFLGIASANEFAALATDRLYDFGVLKAGNGRTQGASRYRYSKSGERIDNITDWALNKFTRHYGKRAGVTKDAIFAYCYAVLHDPVYREKYALNLKRQFPRIPLYPDFARWVEWGETLLDLHIDYEEVEPWPLERVDTPNSKRAEGSQPKPKLKSVLAEGAETGSVVVDEDTQITGIPAGAWDYRLGNRSAIDWVLDQHKEKKPRDPTIREKFNTYRFADYKESMIELLAKVVRVSVETVAITDAMAALDDGRLDQKAA
ncbi:N-6 DNA methylase [Parasphingopyxis algicola]|uniref:type ISP restriction/modification enzyme n=1 Tax=Parasphingopyxis algicola TaxID=2026624 RepID=UPI0015A21E9E|nr:type ISP restriction/modification enzyme [Parasphingopyxis algicola]QLC23614.1 N-6 DNA methylase [Parasphingopyxis algicola]